MIHTTALRTDPCGTGFEYIIIFFILWQTNQKQLHTFTINVFILCRALQ
jgi:hypothetical protein